MQYDDLALVERQRRQRPAYVHRIVRLNPARLGRLAHQEAARRSGTALPVGEQAEGDLAHPGLRIVVAADLGPPRNQPDEGFLHYLLGFAAITGCDGEDADEARV